MSRAVSRRSFLKLGLGAAAATTAGVILPSPKAFWFLRDSFHVHRTSWRSAILAQFPNGDAPLAGLTHMIEQAKANALEQHSIDMERLEWWQGDFRRPFGFSDREGIRVSPLSADGRHGMVTAVAADVDHVRVGMMTYSAPGESGYIIIGEAYEEGRESPQPCQNGTLALDNGGKLT